MQGFGKMHHLSGQQPWSTADTAPNGFPCSVHLHHYMHRCWLPVRSSAYTAQDDSSEPFAALPQEMARSRPIDSKGKKGFKVLATCLFVSCNCDFAAFVLFTACRFRWSPSTARQAYMVML